MRVKYILVLFLLILLTACNQNKEIQSDVPMLGDSERLPLVLTAVDFDQPSAPTFLASDGDHWDRFGSAVAIDGDTAVIGAWLDEGGGSAYVYTRASDGTWSEQEKLLPGAGGSGQRFGAAVAITGNTIFVGAPLYANNGGNGDGSVYVFEYDGTSWVRGKDLSPNSMTMRTINPDFISDYGRTLALDGSQLVIGARSTSSGFPTLKINGAAFIYENVNGTWTDVAEVFVDQDIEPNASFGRTIAIDGNTLAIGSANLSTSNGIVTGPVFVFTKENNVWTKQASVLPTDPVSLQNRTQGLVNFGDSISLNGSTLLVGATGVSIDGVSNTGAAFVFENSLGTWTQQGGPLLPASTSDTDQVGASVKVVGDFAFVGATRAEAIVDNVTKNNAGSIYVFERVNGTWNYETQIFPGDLNQNDWFGYALDIDGNTLVASSYQDGNNGGGSGSAYIVNIGFDSTPPDITANLQENIWYTDDVVELIWTVNDDESTASVVSDCVDTDIIDDTDGEVYSCTASSLGGEDTVSIIIKRDATAPVVTITGVNDGDVFELGSPEYQALTLGCDVDDSTASTEGSGVNDDATTLGVTPDANNHPTDGTGSFSVQCDAEDNAGNMASTSLTYTVIHPEDTTPPVITYEILGTLGSNGWYISDVTLVWTVTDEESEFMTTGCEEVFINTDTTGIQYSCIAESDGGEITVETEIIKRDITPPTIDLNGLSDPPIYVLNSGNVPTIESLSCTDEDITSGLAFDFPPPVDIIANANNPGDGTGLFDVVCDSADKASNTSFVNVEFEVVSPPDTTPPVITTIPSSSPNSNNWFNTDVTVSYSCTDDSGINANASDLTSDVLSSSGTVNATCVDNAGNSASASYTAQIDKVLPSIQESASPTANAAGWNNSDVTVSYTCTDTNSGVDSMASELGSDVLNSSDSVEGSCVDLAGNSITASYSAQIDKTKPIIQSSVSPSANADGWNNSAVTVSFSCSDTGSGIAQDFASGSTQLSSEGSNQSVASNGVCTDIAGNSTDSISVNGINIDLNVPNVSVTGVAAGTTYPQGNVPTPSCSTQDDLSGVATQASINPSGGPTGPITVSCSGAVDNAGNNQAAPVSVTYIVEATQQGYNFNGFYNPVSNPSSLNNVKAGRTIPMKFSLGGDFGLNIFAAGYPQSRQITCSSSPSVIGSPSSTYSNGGLSYSGGSSDQYNYKWKTEKSWKKTCREFVLLLDDGTQATAYFEFK